MRLEEHYLTLRHQYSESSEGESFHLSIPEIAELLECSERNAKLIMKNMSELDWIQWDVFKGRGKKPLLTFLYSKTEMEHLFVKDLIAQGKYTEVIEKLNKYDFHIQEELEHFLDDYFGLSVEQELHTQTELDVLRCPIQQKVKNIDPLKSISRQDHEIVSHLFDSLFIFDYESQKVKPHICFHWEHNVDGTEWYLYLRKGVYFHHGRSLDVQDVIFTIEHISRNEGYKHWYQNTHFETLTAISDYVLKISLSKPNFLLLNELCSKRTSILPREWNELLQESNLSVGTGPYKVIEWHEGKVILAAHEHYFQMRPHIDRIEFIYVNQSYQTDSLLFSYPDMYHEGAHWKPIKQIPNGASYLSINSRKPGIHNHPSFKKALARIIWNYKTHTEDELTLPAYHFLYEEDILAHETQTSLSDPSVIPQLLTEANYQGEALALFVPYVDSDMKQDPFVEKIVPFCQTYGITINIHPIAIRDLLEPQHMAKADMIFITVIVEEDIVLSLSRIFSNPLGFICNSMSDKEQQALFLSLSQIKSLPRRDDQLQTILSIEQQLIESNKVLFVHHHTFQLFFNEKKSMEGINIFQTGGVNYSKVWYKKVDS